MHSHFSNYQIDSIVSCVPSDIQLNKALPFDEATIKKVSKSSGIKSRRIADDNTTASDLCTQAAEHLLESRKIDKKGIGVLIFVTQYPDYILPSTAHIIKERLGLPQSTIAIQINEGCSGYIYGLQMCLSLLESVKCDLGMLLTGDTTSKVLAIDDSGTRPIFGDAGSATLIKKGSGEVKIQLGSDGSGFKEIIVQKGAFRSTHQPLVNEPPYHHPLGTGQSEKTTQVQSELPTLKMNGMNVFMFGISRIPKYIKEFCVETNTEITNMDYLILHQANKMMNSRIVRKLGVKEEKALYSLEEFGNTSSASIPLTITHNLKGIKKKRKILACGFGVGLSWGTATFELDADCFLDTIEYTNP